MNVPLWVWLTIIFVVFPLLIGRALWRLDRGRDVPSCDRRQDRQRPLALGQSKTAPRTPSRDQLLVGFASKTETTKYEGCA